MPMKECTPEGAIGTPVELGWAQAILMGRENQPVDERMRTDQEKPVVERKKGESRGGVLEEVFRAVGLMPRNRAA